MGSHRDRARSVELSPVTAPGRPANEPRAAPDDEEQAEKPALLLIQGGARLTPEQQALVVEARGLARWAIRQRAPHAPAKLREELCAEVLVDVTLAAQRFDPTRGTRFSTYVMPWIWGAIEDFFDKEARHNALLRAAALAARELTAERSGQRVDWAELSEQSPEESEEAAVAHASNLIGTMVAAMAYEHADPEDDVVEQIAHKQVIAATRAAFARMPKVQRRVITMRFLEQQGLRVIAEEIGMDERSVTRHLDRALDRLRAEMAEAGFTEMPRVRG